MPNFYELVLPISEQEPSSNKALTSWPSAPLCPHPSSSALSDTGQAPASSRLDHAWTTLSDEQHGSSSLPPSVAA